MEPGHERNDLLLWWLALAGLALYGVLFVYSTGYIGGDYAVRPVWRQHAVWLLLAAVLFWGVSRLSPSGRLLDALVWLGYGASLLGLVAVLLVGKQIGGARRWLDLGSLTLQPAEFAKVFTLLAVARLLARPADSGGRLWRLATRTRLRRTLLLLAAVALPAALIVVEPSAGNSCTLLPATAVAIGLRLPWRRLWNALLALTLVACVAAAAALVWLRSADEAEGLVSAIPREGLAGGLVRGYHLRRVAAYLSPKGSWNERQSVMTLASGGAFGKGYLEGTMKGLGYLPRTVAPTDFIFSVIGEEMGFLFGTLPVLLLYLTLLWLGLGWAARTRDRAAGLACAELMTLLATHVLVNVAMTVRLLPIIGLPLPLLSYGGSFTLAIALALGVVCGAGRDLEGQTSALRPPTDRRQVTPPRRLSLTLIPGLLRLNLQLRDGDATSRNETR